MTIFNPTRQPLSCSLNWQDFNLTDEEVSKRSTAFDQNVYKIKNLWTGRMEGKTTLKSKIERKVSVPAQDVITYRLIKQ